ncbi:MAG: PDR/VanB family oxidoreductase [Burkholderiales bacterium]
MIPLKIVRAEPLAQGIQLFDLRDPSGAVLPEFTPGAHLVLRTPNGLSRKYSLCNDAAERDRYVIGVKREAAGRGGSMNLVDSAKVGDMIEVTPPENAFPLHPGAKNFIFIAGGIGITPIMAMIRHLVSSDRGNFKLYYLTRDAATTAFLNDLSSTELRAKVNIHHDQGDPANSFDLWPVLEKPDPAHIYCCGPRPLMDAVRDMTGHWQHAQIHFESFLDAEQTRAVDNKPFRLRLARSNAVLEVRSDQSIIQAMRANGFDAPTSCESGTCGTCRTALLEGEADHRDLVLMDEEQASQIMICVSRARSAELVVDL